MPGVQRPLWASTGVKNPDYSDTVYVTELVAANTVNTMPEKTMDAVADHGEILGDRVSGTAMRPKRYSTSSTGLVSIWATYSWRWRTKGWRSFKKSWQELLEATQDQLDAAT